MSLNSSFTHFYICISISRWSHDHGLMMMTFLTKVIFILSDFEEQGGCSHPVTSVHPDEYAYIALTCKYRG